MKRATIVLSTTAAGLLAVLSFHTAPAPVSLTLPGVSAARQPVATGRPSASGSGAPGTGTTGSTGSGGSSTPGTTAPATGSAGTRTAVGAAADYGYGVLSVSVTASGSKITNIQIASIDDGGNFRSQSIDQQAIPILEQQAMQAQGANIQGVSGATYTSQGFVQSLQSALSKLGI